MLRSTVLPARPGDEPAWAPGQMSPMVGRHVRVVGAVATDRGTPGMACHPAATDEDLDRRGRDADLGPLADELIGHAVVVAVDLDVVVDADLGPLPGRELVWPIRQWPESRRIDREKDAAPAAFELSEGPVVQPLESLSNGDVGFREREEGAVAQGREDPALGHLDSDLDLGLVSRFARAGRDDGAAVVGGKIGIGAVELRLVSMRPIDCRLQVVGNQDRGHPAEELERPDVRGAPVRQFLRRQCFRVCVARGTQDSEKELGVADLACVRVDDTDGLAGEVEKELLAGIMVLAHHEIELADIGVIGLGEPGVSEAVGIALPILGPQEGLGDSGPAQLGVDLLPIWDRPRQDGRRRSRPPEEPLF
jgi:hypothetical protein